MTNMIQSETPDQRNYLFRELRNAREKIVETLSVTYGLEDNVPKDTYDAVQMVKDGKIIINDKTARLPYYAWADSIRFRDPSLKEDHDGFKVAKSTMDKAVNDVERIIKIKTPDEGLAAVIDFESKTFH